MEGIVAAFLLTFGMLMLEAFMPKYTSTSPVSSTLERREFVDLGFTVGYPSGWQVAETARGVTFRSGERAGSRSTRGFVVVPEEITFSEVEAEAELVDSRRFTEYVVLASGPQTLAGQRAHRRLVAAEGFRIDQWWIEHGNSTVRVEFRSRGADDDAAAINARILDTLDLL